MIVDECIAHDEVIYESFRLQDFFFSSIAFYKEMRKEKNDINSGNLRCFSITLSVKPCQNLIYWLSDPHLWRPSGCKSHGVGLRLPPKTSLAMPIPSGTPPMGNSPDRSDRGPVAL